MVVLATFAVYARTLSFQFVFDDRPWLVENPALHSWKYLPDYFTKHVWAGVYTSDVGNYYRPVFMLWMRLNVWLFGADPGGYHLVVVLLHVLATLLVYGLGRRISGDRALALAAAAIFGLHPVHIESVAWILGSTDSLAAVFLLSSFLCWDRSRDSVAHRGRWLAASWALFAIGLLAKETALLFPLLLIGHVWAVHEGTWDRSGILKTLRESLRSAGPYVAIMIPYLVVRWQVLHGFSHPSTAVTWSSL
ncbi:MAG: glycosyltransferase family 39 protein, partial [Deltaproteobacteria bacterium]